MTGKRLAVKGLADRPEYMGMTETTCVYFALSERDGLVKIGYSQAPYYRVHNLGLQSGQMLKILALVKGDHRREGEFHKALAHLRVKGEWFRDTPDLRNEIAAAADRVALRAPIGGSPCWHCEATEDLAVYINHSDNDAEITLCDYCATHPYAKPEAMRLAAAS